MWGKLVDLIAVILVIAIVPFLWAVGKLLDAVEEERREEEVEIELRGRELCY